MPDSRDKRRWYQFSVLTMLVVSFVFSAVLAMLVTPPSQTHEASIQVQLKRLNDEIPSVETQVSELTYSVARLNGEIKSGAAVFDVNGRTLNREDALQFLRQQFEILKGQHSLLGMMLEERARLTRQVSNSTK